MTAEMTRQEQSRPNQDSRNSRVSEGIYKIKYVYQSLDHETRERRRCQKRKTGSPHQEHFWTSFNSFSTTGMLIGWQTKLWRQHTKAECVVYWSGVVPEIHMRYTCISTKPLVCLVSGTTQNRFIKAFMYKCMGRASLIWRLVRATMWFNDHDLARSKTRKFLEENDVLMLRTLCTLPSFAVMPDPNFTHNTHVQAMHHWPKHQHQRNTASHNRKCTTLRHSIQLYTKAKPRRLRILS